MHRADDVSAPAFTEEEVKSATDMSSDQHPTAPRPSSSVLYTLLQDLGLSATAQALCDELRRQQATPATASTATADTATATATAVKSTPPSRSTDTTGVSTGATRQEQQAPHTQAHPSTTDNLLHSSPSSPPPVSPLPPSAAAAAAAAVQPEAVAPLPNGSNGSDLLHGDAECTAAAAALVSFALEPLQGEERRPAVSNTVSTNANGSSVSGGGSSSNVEAALRVLWQREAASVTPTKSAAAAAAADAAREFRVVTLLARAACCEVRIAEGVFSQEYHLVHASPTTPSASSAAVLHRIQSDLVEHAAQLIASVQELRTLTSLAVRGGSPAPLSSLIVSRLHAKSSEWLRSAECVLTWVLRRQANFEAPPAQQSQQQHKRRCLEQQSSTNVPQHLQPLQSAILSFPLPSTHETAQVLLPSTGSRDGGARHAEALCPLPFSVRLAMSVQRVKLVLALTAALTYNGERSIVCGVVEAATTATPAADGAERQAERSTSDVLRRWWTGRCLVQAQLLRQAALHLRSHLPSVATAKAEAHAFISLLDAQARQLLLSQAAPNGLGALLAAAETSPQQPLGLTAALLRALADEQAERAAWLDRFVLERSSATPLPKTLAPVHHSSSDTVRSPNLSVGSPAVPSESSSVGSPVWTLPLPCLPGDAATAAATGSAAAASSSSPRAAAAVNFSAVEKIAADAAAGEVAATAASAAASARTAARVLRWQPHFSHLLTTIATGQWQAPQSTQPVLHPCARYNRTRLNLMRAVRNAQELLRLQPRREVTANGQAYVPRPGGGLGGSAASSLVEDLPRTVQVFTLQDTRILRRAQRRLSARGARASAESPVNGPRTPQRQQQKRRASTSPAAAAAAAATSVPSASSPLHGIAAALFSAMSHATVTIAANANTTTASAAAAAMTHGGGGSAERSVGSRQESPALQSRAAQQESASWSPDSAQAETAESLLPPSSPPSSASSPPVPSLENEEQPTSSSSNTTSRSEEDEEEREEEEEELLDTEDEEAAQQAVEHSAEEAINMIYGGEGVGEEAEGEEETDEEWSQSAVDVGDEEHEEQHEEEEEDEEAFEEEDGDGGDSEASSADLDYNRAEDAMKEEVECVEVTPDGRLLALLTARGRLTVLRLQARDTAQHYEEEVLLDAVLPRAPEKRLQWYESLASFVHFSPCHRFVLASVQFSAIREKQSARCALSRVPQTNTGEVCIFSLHRSEEEEEDDDKEGETSRSAGVPERRGSRSRSRSLGASNSPSNFAERLGRLLQPLPERLYECVKPHTAPCLSARWVDPRWWGGGRRSGWANAAAEPLNTTTAAAAVVVRGAEGVDSTPARPQTREALPSAWRVAAALLLSEYQCLSIGLDDKIVRWMPSSGVVLQCILTEPVQDLVVSPLMAAFYVVSDAGDLVMYDAWDERDTGDVSSPSIWANARDVCEYDAHPLMLSVTEDGHPCCYRTGASTRPYATGEDGGSGAGVSGQGSETERQQVPQRPARRRSLDGAHGGGDEVRMTRHAVHYTGPVTPVFQRMIDPAEKQRRRMPLLHSSSSSSNKNFAQRDQARGETGVYSGEASEADSGAERGNDTSGSGVRCLPRSLRWLLPHRWTAHTPWDAQLGRRLIRHLLRRSSAPSAADEGQLHYECDDDADAAAAAAGGAGCDTAALSAPNGDGVGQRRVSRLEHASEEEDGAVGARGGGAFPHAVSDDPSDADNAESEEEDVEEGWEYDYTTSAHREDDGVRPPPQLSHAAFAVNDAASATAVAAAARDAPVAVKESAAHPTPARGTLRRAYYPSGSCLVYKSVAQALCAASDLADRQRNEEMGPGGFTHHLLSFALSGEPKWTARRRLCACEEGEEEEDEGRQATARTEQQQQQSLRPPTPSLLWPTTALARLLLWRGCLGSLRHLDRTSPHAWALWESKVLSTTFHADLASPAKTSPTTETEAPGRFSAAQLLLHRGYQRPRDVWRRGPPAAQRGLAATARNGRYLCVMATAGPYRKLVNAREPLRDIKGFYACVVFDLYAGAVLRVIPVCPVDPSGLRGVNMVTSEQHNMGAKAPLYRLQCAVTIVPVVTAAATGGKEGESRYREAKVEEEAEEDAVAEPKEIIAVTIGGLGNTIYVYDAMSGRRIACTREVEHCCGLSAAAAYEATHAVTAATSIAAAATAGAIPVSTASPSLPHNVSGARQPSAVAASPPQAQQKPSLNTSSSSLLPSSIRTPADVLASVATWGRGTGFDGITDHSTTTSSSSSSAEELTTRGAAGGPATVVVVVSSESAMEERGEAAAAAQKALREALNSGDGQHRLPPLLVEEETTPGSPDMALGLRETLAAYHHRNGTPHASAAAGNVGERRSSSSSSDSDGSSDGGSGTSGEEGESGEFGSATHTPQQRQQHTRNGGSGDGKQNGRPADTHNGAAAAAASSPTSTLSSFYHALLGASTTHADASAVVQGHNGGGRRTSLVASRRAQWRRQRQRLLERVLRHYPVDLLWQAYVALFTTSATAVDAAVPLSAVAALVQWARQTAASTGVGGALGIMAAPAQSWVWCAPRRLSVSSPLLLTATGTAGSERDAAQREEKKTTSAAGNTSSGSGTVNRVPFAHVLQRREELIGELEVLDAQRSISGGPRTRSDTTQQQPSPPSLLSRMRSQAMLDGSLPPDARLLRAQQRAAGGPTTKKFPSVHHQNQLRLDVVNAVATWMDVNGGFYICFGSEDGGLYLLGGNVDA